MVREAHGLEQLMSIVKDKNMRENKPLLAAATGALWKCTLVEENVKLLDNVICDLFKIFHQILESSNLTYTPYPKKYGSFHFSSVS